MLNLNANIEFVFAAKAIFNILNQRLKILMRWKIKQTLFTTA